MNLFNLGDFVIFAGEESGIFQLVVAAVIIVTSVIASAKSAKKKQQQEQEKQRRKDIEKPQQSYVQNKQQTQQQKPQSVKFWGVPLEKIDENDDEYVDYDEYDDDDYDPLEPQPKSVQKSFAHKINDHVFAADKEHSNFVNMHLQSDVENKHLHSSIENQTLGSSFKPLDVMSGMSESISGKVHESGKRKVKIEITVPKGSSEALVHAVVLGEIFGPPITLREPYKQADDEYTFKKSTLF